MDLRQSPSEQDLVNVSDLFSEEKNLHWLLKMEGELCHAIKLVLMQTCLCVVKLCLAGMRIEANNFSVGTLAHSKPDNTARLLKS